MTGGEATLLGFGVAAVAAAALLFASARRGSGRAQDGVTSYVTTQKTANGLAQQGQSGGPGVTQQVQNVAGNVAGVAGAVASVAGAVGGLAGTLGGMFGGGGAGSADTGGSSLDFGFGDAGDSSGALAEFSGGTTADGGYDFGAGLDFSGDGS